MDDSLDSRVRDLYEEREPPVSLADSLARELFPPPPAAGPAAAGAKVGWSGWALRAAAAVLVFTAGAALARYLEAPSSTAATAAPGAVDEAEYLLVLHEPSSFRPDRDPELVVDEYVRWAQAVPPPARVVGGERLSRDGILLQPTNVPDPGADGAASAVIGAAPARVGGFFAITAPTLEEAARVGATHPHLRYGGWVEVRRIERTR